jgi:Transposase IS116/IS110/IS902 family
VKQRRLHALAPRDGLVAERLAEPGTDPQKADVVRRDPGFGQPAFRKEFAQPARVRAIGLGAPLAPAKPSLLAGFLGIVPSERTSDTKRRQGITKTGPGHARRLLVEAAHHYRYRPVVGQTLTRRQEGQDPRIVEIAWRAQRRLHQRWQVLLAERRKPAGVVAIACARELAAFLWEAATLD